MFQKIISAHGFRPLENDVENIVMRDAGDSFVAVSATLTSGFDFQQYLIALLPAWGFLSGSMGQMKRHCRGSLRRSKRRFRQF